MKTLYVILASIVGTGMITSCSDNEPVVERDTGNAISFGADRKSVV